MKARNKSGFTLVEILIVVVILGILAAIVIPQFSQASTDARKSSVKSNLQMVRSQIELYKIQHDNEQLPGKHASKNLIQALTEKTKSDGSAWAIGDTETSFGKYMQKFPVNANNGKGGVISEIQIGTGATETAAANATTDGTYGWYYNSTTGEFAAIDCADSLEY